MKRESKNILLLLEDGEPRSAYEVADELFTDLSRTAHLMRTMCGMNYLVASPDDVDGYKYKISGRALRFIAKFRPPIS